MPLVRILSSKLTPEEHLGFLRRQWKEGPQAFHEDYANELFSALFYQPWSAEQETEALVLLAELSMWTTQPAGCVPSSSRSTD
jgi:hypothetical protein